MLGLYIIELESAWLLEQEEEPVWIVLIAPSSWGILLKGSFIQGPLLSLEDEAREGQ